MFTSRVLDCLVFFYGEVAARYKQMPIDLMKNRIDQSSYMQILRDIKRLYL